MNILKFYRYKLNITLTTYFDMTTKSNQHVNEGLIF